MTDRVVEVLLSDVDTFTSWLADQCHKAPLVELGYVDTLSHRVLARCDDASIPELVALALYPAPETAYWAMAELRKRFVAEHQEYLRQIEAEL